MNRAAVAYVTRADGRVLVVWNKRYGGWAMPGGLVEESETPKRAQVRELFEETGLRTTSTHEIYDAPTDTQQDGRGSHCHVYRVKAEGEPRECEVGCPVTWFTREEFLKWSPFAKFYEKMFATLDDPWHAYDGPSATSKRTLCGKPLSMMCGEQALDKIDCPECLKRMKETR